VFICNVEIVNNPQDRIGWIGCFVWLQRFDQGAVGSGDALYYSVPHGLFKFLGTIADRKLDTLVIGDGVLLGERPDHMIEGRSQVVNDLASNNSDPQGRWRTQQFEGISPTFRLIFSNNGVNATVKETGDFRIEITDLLFDPLNLGPTAVKRMGHGNPPRQSQISRRAARRLGASNAKDAPEAP